MRHNQRFARWLAEARHASSLTQEEMAEAIDISQATVSSWEREGREAMSPQEIRVLARVLRVDPVKVAEALGYPIRPRGVVTSAIPAAALEELMDEVRAAQEKVIAAWAKETFKAMTE